MNILTKIECTDNHFAEDLLTVGKTYCVIEETNDYVMVVDDRNKTNSFGQTRFKRKSPVTKGVV